MFYFKKWTALFYYNYCYVDNFIHLYIIYKYKYYIMRLIRYNNFLEDLSTKKCNFWYWCSYIIVSSSNRLPMETSSKALLWWYICRKLQDGCVLFWLQKKNKVHFKTITVYNILFIILNYNIKYKHIYNILPLLLYIYIYIDKQKLL